MFIGIANSIGQRFGGGGFDPDAQAFLSAAGITGSTEAAAVNTLVTDLKSSNIWTKMKALYPFVTDNRNLLSYTEDFGNGAWLKSNVTVTTNTTIAPNGTLTADTLDEGGTLNYHYMRQIPPTLSSSNVVASCYIKKNTGRYVRLILSGGNSTAWVAAQFDLDTLTFTSGEGTNATGAFVNASITEENNGFYRCQIAINYSSVTNFWISSSDGSAILSTDDFGRAYYQGTNKSIYIWGAQLELGSSATTYQPIATTQQSYISSQFKYNLKDPRDLDAAFRLVFNGGWTHSSTGATPNGTNGYADTKLVPSSVLTQDSTHLSFYSRTDQATATNAEMGAFDTSTGVPIMLLAIKSNSISSGDNYDLRVGYLNNTFLKTTAPTNTQGYAVNTKLNSNLTKGFWNNSLLGSVTYTNALTNKAIFIGSRNADGTANNFSLKQTAFASIGDGLSDTEASNLYTAVQAFQTSLSRQV